MSNEEAYALTAHATSPWAERPFAAEKPITASPPPECELCGFQDCKWDARTGCPSKNGHTKVGRGRKKDEPNDFDRTALKYIMAGYCDGFICRELHIRRRQLDAERKRLERLGLY